MSTPEQPEPLALPPGTEVQHPLGARLLAEHDHYGPGNVLVARELMGERRDPVAWLELYDKKGNPIHTAHRALGIPLEGYDTVDGVNNAVMERDDHGKPLTIMGLASGDANVRAIAAAYRNAGSEISKYAAVPDSYTTYLTYNTQGMIETIIKTEEERQGSVAKSRLQYFYDADGQCSGFLTSELVDTVGDTEHYRPTRATFLSYDDDRYQAIYYHGVEDGLMPLSVQEGQRGQIADTEFRVPLNYTSELRPYYLARHPQAITLFEFQIRPVRYAGDETRIVPSFIPLDHIESALAGQLGIEQAASQPDLPLEIQACRVLAPEEALAGLLETADIQAPRDVINNLGDRQTVVLHTERPDDAVPAHHMARDAASALTNTQKLAALAVLHPSFGREYAVPDGAWHTVNDQSAVMTTMDLLHTDMRTLRDEFAALAPQLNARARRCFEYLLGLDDTLWSQS